MTLGRVPVHLVVEVARHLGHADILRELTDGGAGLLAGDENLPDHDADWWFAHVSRLQQVAEESGEGTRPPGSPTP